MSFDESLQSIASRLNPSKGDRATPCEYLEAIAQSKIAAVMQN
jgi:hypothetical protein